MFYDHTTVQSVFVVVVVVAEEGEGEKDKEYELLGTSTAKVGRYL